MNRSTALVFVAVLLALLAGSYLLGEWPPGDGRSADVEHEGRDRLAPDKEPALAHESSEVMIERAVGAQERATVAVPAPLFDSEATPSADAEPEHDEPRLEDVVEAYEGPYKYMGPASREKTPAWVFDAEYPTDLGLRELQDLYSALLQENREIRERLLDARYEAGLYDVTPIRMKQSFAEGHIARVTLTEDHEQRTIILPFDEFPDVYEAVDRWAYLAGRIVQAKKGK